MPARAPSTSSSPASLALREARSRGPRDSRRTIYPCTELFNRSRFEPASRPGPPSPRGRKSARPGVTIHVDFDKTQIALIREPQSGSDGAENLADALARSIQYSWLFID